MIFDRSQFLLYWLGWHIANYIQTFGEPPAEVYPDVVVILSRDPRRVLAPDLAIILAGNSYRISGGYFEGVPDIVVEVLSSDRNQDLIRKRQIYADAGVSEYWIFDPVNDTALLLELRDGDYVSRGLLTADDTLTTPLLPGLAIPLAELFHHRQRPADV